MNEDQSPLRLTVARVGFIGTSETLNPKQLARIRAVLVGLGATELHHGGRIGADVQAHVLADELGLWRFVHPDEEVDHRAYLPSEAVHPPEPRERAQGRIVDMCQAVVAVPGADECSGRGATWRVVKSAEATRKPVVVVGANGEVLYASPVVFGSACSIAPW